MDTSLAQDVPENKKSSDGKSLARTGRAFVSNGALLVNSRRSANASPLRPMSQDLKNTRERSGPSWGRNASTPHPILPGNEVPSRNQPNQNWIGESYEPRSPGSLEDIRTRGRKHECVKTLVQVARAAL